MNLQEAFVSSADGTTIQYLTYGQGKPVILIHGLQGSAAVWYLLLSDLPKGYQYIMPNLRGRAKSGQPSQPSQYKLDCFVDDLQAVVVTQTQPVVIVGWSMGASIAWQFASRPQATQVSAWVFVSGTPDPVHTRALFDSDEDLLGALRQRIAHLPTGVACPVEVASQAWHGFRNADFLNNPPELKVPSLFIHGDCDPDCPIESAHKLAQKLSSQWVVFEGSGHAPIRDDPKRFAKVLGDFLVSAQIAS